VVAVSCGRPEVDTGDAAADGFVPASAGAGRLVDFRVGFDENRRPTGEMRTVPFDNRSV
jgi:hypothetical protein